MKRLFIHLLFFLNFFSTSIGAQSLEFFNLKQLIAEQAPEAISVSVQDPVYQKEKAYLAYPLAQILSALKKPPHYRAEDLLILLQAKDGYQAFLSYADALKNSGYLAFKDKATATGQNWVKFKFGNEMATPEPFYLVWPDADLPHWQYPWPFQVTSIALQSTQDYFANIAPIGKENSINNGFANYTRYCIRCHAINAVGGTLAADLTHPLNVSSMYDAAYLRNFIKNAPQYNKNTRMPAFNTMLNDKEISEILRYLQYIGDQKKIEP